MSGTQTTIRRKRLRAALCRTGPALPFGLAGLLLINPVAGADTATWDCRMATDGRSWQCYRDGQLVEDPTPPAQPAAAQTIQAADVTPTPAAAPAQSEPAPAPAARIMPSEPVPAPPPARIDVPAADSTPATAKTAVSPTLDDAADTAPPAVVSVPADRTPSVAPQAPARAMPPGGAAATQALQGGEMPDLLEPSTATVAPAATLPAEADAAAPPAQPMTGGLDAGIDWDTCRAGLGAAGAVLPSGSSLEVGAPVSVSADAAVAELAPQQALFSGHVELVRGTLLMQADQLALNRTTGEVRAQGGFLLSEPDIRVAGSAATYQLTTGQGAVEQASYRVPAIRARGDAEHAEFLGDGRSQFRQISYTTCAPGKSDWLLHADALELDQNEGLGSARHASLRFLGVPILYVPTFTFPIDDRRRSGVLVPSVGYTSNTGADLSVPYYFNLAENYDLTLTPRAMSKRGLMLGGEFRFLTETSSGELAADYLPHDNAYDADGSNARGSVALRTHTQFNPRTESDVRFGYVSDNSYFEDLGGSLAVASTTQVERAGELRYHGDTWDLLGRLQSFQTIDEAIPDADRPYSRLPQLRIDLANPAGIGGTTYHLGAEYVNFYRSDSVRGHRIDLSPAISLPLGDSWWFATPKVGARYTAYRLTDQTPGLEDSPTHLGGMFSFDSGLYFDRGIDYFGSTSTQTLEPRLYYLFVPFHAQEEQPIFDTALFDFSFDNLFRENRFNGPDRIGDANQVTLALTSRVIADQSGGELLRASLGQIVYFRDREVTLPGVTIADDSTSALVAEVAAQLGGGWQTRAGLQWDPHAGGSGTIDQGLAQVSYRDTDRHVFSAAYRLRDNVTEHTDLAFYWPFSEQFSLIGRHNYSLQDDRLLEALAGIEYGRNCCWRIRAIARQYADGTGDNSNLAFMLQLELNGLGRLGDDIDSTLERGVYGYRTGDDD